MTGSFTRSAIKVSSGVNSPADGIFTSAIVLGALYFLTPVFYFIPTAILPAIIIVSISDLIASYPVFIEMWNISIAEFLICLTGMIMTILSTIANGIYTSLALCLLLLLYRLSCPRISLLEKHFAGVSQFTNLNCPPFSLTTTDFTNCIVLRVEESIMFLNAATVVDVIMQFVRKHVNVMGAGSRMADTSASPDSTVCIEHDSGGGGGKQPKRKQTIGNVYPVIKGRLSKDNINNSVQQSSFSASYLRSLVFDFSSVNMLDATAVHALRCLRNQLTQHLFPNKDMNVDLDCWSSNNTLPDTLEFHFVHVKPHLHRIVVNLLIPQIADIQGSSGKFPSFFRFTPSQISLIIFKDITNLANLEQVASRYIHPDLETALEVARCVV